MKWKKASGVKGYELAYGTAKNFKKVKTKLLSKNKTSYTIKKLKTGKKYYVRIRGYKAYSDSNGKMVKVYGKWTSLSKKTK